MIKAALLATTLCLMTATAALAQDMTAAERNACIGDYEKFCKGTIPGGGRIIACLEKQHARLADACKKVVDARKK
ncbi:MAG: hypothetical protein AB7O50_10925 [Pseudolabrys sp.]